MLASLLPGLRDVRTPLAVGYVWFLNLWLVFGSRAIAAQKNKDALIGHLAALNHVVGQGAAIAAASFAAFLLGSMLTIRSDSFSSAWSVLANRKVDDYEVDLLGQVSMRLQSEGLPEPPAVSSDVIFPVEDFRARLLVANAEMYGEFDRFESEAVFRINVSFPLLALGLIVAIQSATPLWTKIMIVFAAVIMVGILFVQGRAKNSLADQVLVRSVVSGIIEHPIVADMLAAHRIEERNRQKDESAWKRSEEQKKIRREALANLSSLHKSLRQAEISYSIPGPAAREELYIFKERQENYRQRIREQEAALMDLWEAS